MYKSYEEAKSAAIATINKLYGGDKMGCCITESKMTKKSRKTWWNFRFYSKDSNGEFIQNKDGSYTRLYRI